MAARRSRRPVGAAVSGWPSRGDGSDWPFPHRSPRPHQPPAPAPPSVGRPRREGGPVMSCAYLALLAEHACCARTWTPGDRLRLPGHLRRFLRAEAEAAAATSTTASRAAAGLDQRADLLARTVQRAF